jgi:hypothetical protein
MSLGSLQDAATAAKKSKVTKTVIRDIGEFFPFTFTST